MPDFEVPNKRYVTTITIERPGYRVFVDSWEEAEEIAKALVEDHVSEKDRSTTQCHIAPLVKVKTAWAHGVKGADYQE